jgi:arylsulfatase A-like enzyme
MPTVADLIGGETPPFVQGASMVSTLNGDRDWSADYSIAEGDFCTSLNKDHWKMLHVDTTGSYYLYKLDDDPLGMADVTDRYPAEAGEMRSLLDEYLAGVAELKAGQQKQLSGEEIKQLRALGYIQ